MINLSYKDFGRSLEDLRIKAKLSYERLGLAMSYNPGCGNKDKYRSDSYVQRYCKYPAGSIPKEKIIKEFADFFNISPYYFYEYRRIKLMEFIDSDRRFLDTVEESVSKYKLKKVDKH